MKFIRIKIVREGVVARMEQGWCDGARIRFLCLPVQMPLVHEACSVLDELPWYTAFSWQIRTLFSPLVNMDYIVKFWQSRALGKTSTYISVLKFRSVKDTKGPTGFYSIVADAIVGQLDALVTKSKKLRYIQQYVWAGMKNKVSNACCLKGDFWKVQHRA